MSAPSKSVQNAIDGAATTLIHGGVPALATWLAGLGLHAGYHISVPFLGTWAAVLGGLLVVAHFAYAASGGFHMSKSDWAAELKVAEHEGLALVLDKLNNQSKSAG